MKRILKAVTELWAGQEYHRDPLGTRSWGQMSHFPRKVHLDPQGVLHVQYEKNPPSDYRVMGRTKIFTWANKHNKHITLTPREFFGVKCVTTHKRHIYTSWGSYMCNKKRILQAVTELWPVQEYSLGQISISLWPPGGQVFRGQMRHNQQKAHLHLLGVLHVQHVNNPLSGYRVTGRTRI